VQAAVHRLVRRRPYLPPLLLAAASLALLADANTVAPAPLAYTYWTTLEQPDVELTAEAPIATLRVRVRALDLAPNGMPTTDDQDIQVVGKVSGSTGVMAVEDAALVDAALRFADPEHPGSFFPPDYTAQYTQSVSEFQSGAWAADFSGSCTEIVDSDPCTTEFLLELRRSDAGRGGGSVYVSWQLAMSASVYGDGQEPSVGPLELPWEVQVTPQVAR
jgi:hypothetical protein